MIRYLLIAAFLFLFQPDLFSGNKKVLVISSYGTDYQWSNSIMDAINQKLKQEHPSIEFSREFLSSEFLGDTDTWGDKVSVLLSNYRKTPPLAIVLLSDEAWMAYQDADVSAFKDVPLVLCAVKPHTIRSQELAKRLDSLQLSHFTPTTQVMEQYNATGVLREMNVSGYLSLMNRLIDKLNRFVFITDSRFYGVYTRLLLQQEAEKYYPDIPVDYFDGRFESTHTLLSSLSDIPPTAGVLLTSWLTGDHGFEYSKDYMYSRMESDLRAPIFITSNIGLEKEYFVGGYFNDDLFWGQKAADMLNDILGGKSPKDIRPVILHDEQCQIAWKVFERYHLNLEKLPDNVVFYNCPESFLSIYRYYIIGFFVAFLIFFLFFLYALRSNYKLQNAHRLLLKAINEAVATNAELEKTHTHLTVALHKAEESDRLKSAFLANMSHEIRTPLNAIVGFSGVIVELDSKEERAEFAELIQRNSDLLLQLISDILDVSKIEAGVLDMTFGEVDAFDICTNVVTSLQSRCKADVKLFLSDQAVAMKLYTDPNRLMQVLINLVNNAIKFTPSGTIEVGYFPCSDGEQVEFFVKDTGVGMSQDKLAAIFDRFTKLNTFVEGTGLGLSISKTIVEMLGGGIGVESQVGVGSRFWFRINKKQQ